MALLYRLISENAKVKRITHDKKPEGTLCKICEKRFVHRLRENAKARHGHPDWGGCLCRADVRKAGGVSAHLRGRLGNAGGHAGMPPAQQRVRPGMPTDAGASFMIQVYAQREKRTISKLLCDMQKELWYGLGADHAQPLGEILLHLGHGALRIAHQGIAVQLSAFLTGELHQSGGLQEQRGQRL